MEDIRAHGWQIDVAIVVYIRVVHVLHSEAIRHSFIPDNRNCSNKDTLHFWIILDLLLYLFDNGRDSIRSSARDNQ
jgi:hypothetical protein